MTQDDFFNFSGLLKPHFKAVCPVTSRPIQELYFKRNAPLNWHGAMNSAVLVARGKGKVREPVLAEPEKLYASPIPVSEAKCKDIQVLKTFCSPAKHAFFDNIPHLGSAVDNLHGEESTDSDSD
ncbi:hypothetical protein RRG08_062114 [Elysia crispata]|uniref:Uncharacterized protein n=1 Tax=Elysia crispata TaxID=231223 RepID=A0AAE1DG68_9GAST|nr:hypothetical protein RRG08_062114 [Elysia crispata]